jgi:hypothetical protein
MPIVKISGKIVYFAHVPKCAGTAMEIYLTKAFGTLAFRDTKFHARAPGTRWTKGSPQHVDANAISTLFPSEFFDESFAVVRSPVTRLVSAFRFQRDVEALIGPDVTLAEWLTRVHRTRNRAPWQFDNHTRLMDDIVPQSARIFRLEDGLDAVVPWLQDIAGAEYSLPQTITPHNVTDKRLVFERKAIRPVIPTQNEIALIHRYYRDDFERFHYHPLTGDPIQHRV